MGDGMGYVISVVIGLVVLVFFIYLITFVAVTVVSLAALGGSLWGGGWAIYNYGQSLKENFIDSNRTH